MTVTGINTNAAVRVLQPTGTPLAYANPLLSGSSAVPSGASLGATALGSPSISSRLVSAVKAAVSELRGIGASDDQIRQQIAMIQSQAPVTLAKLPTKAVTAHKATTPKGKSFTDGAGNLRQVGTGTILKPAAKPVAAAADPTPFGPSLPANATQVPGATVYSYDQNGNPVGGSSPALNPAMLQGVNGMVNAADPQPTPQMNSTNQTALAGNAGVGGVIGSVVPVLGAPIAVAAPAVAVGATGTDGARQTVANANTNDQASLNQTPDFGYGYGATGGMMPFGGVGSGLATPYSPFGTSMTGAYALGTQKQGIWSRLFR